MGVASGCSEQQAGVASGSGWTLWVWLLSVVVRRHIDFHILLIPTPLVYVLFYSSIPTFCSFKNVFSFLFQYFFVITFYVLNIFFTKYKHSTGNYGRPTEGSGGSRGGSQGPMEPPFQLRLCTDTVARLQLASSN